MSSLRSAGRDLLAGSMAIGLVVSATFVASRVFIPAPPSEAVDTTLVTTPDVDLAVEVAALPGPDAIIVTSGSVEGRFVLDGRLPFWVGAGPDPASKDVDILYQGSGAQLKLLARGITVGEPVTDGFTAVFTLDGKTFFPKPGDCTLTITRFEYLQPTDGAPQLVPTFAGELTCTDLTDIRSGTTLSYTGAFDR
jgi:hypothetical protein